MFRNRAKIFIIIVALLFAVCILRLAQMQLVKDSNLDEKIERLKLQQAKSLTTARGRILDRKGRVVASDEPYFELQVDYQLTRWFDERTAKVMHLEATASGYSDQAVIKTEEKIKAGQQILLDVFQKAEQFGLDTQEALEMIKKKNNEIWDLREHLAWKRNFPDSCDFEAALPDANKRLLLTNNVDIAEMHEGFSLIELQEDKQVFQAQIEFADIKGVDIVPYNRRVYPYNSCACHTIGWVGPELHKKLFNEDPLASYLEGEISGRPPGTEYVCEIILRGRRGELLYDIDRELVREIETQLGEDIILSIDIELQKKIEKRILDCNSNLNCASPSSIVVLDIVSGDILAMVSTPIYNLNTIRYEYGNLVSDKREPLRNRAINAHYPPGSVTKPLILLAGLEAGKISSNEVISCPAAPAPQGWPNCWVFNRYRTGHDASWSNYARNAIKGSCNIYFSRLANRMEPQTLQKWLWQFGYGHDAVLEPDEVLKQQEPRHFRQASGVISSENPRDEIKSFDDIPPLVSGELRYFGMGQGNFRVTPLQVANAMAVLARNGLYKNPRLIISPESQSTKSVSLNVSPHTLSVIHDGMQAVVNENGGTAYREFKSMLDYFETAHVTVYGKTGSTQRPDHAWFGGFALDKTGHGISIAVLVEGGQHGSDDAAPLARDTIQYFIEEGYMGQKVFTGSDMEP